MPKRRITMNLPDEVWRRTKEAAAACATSASQFTEEALLERLERRQKDVRRAALARLKAMRVPAGTPQEIKEEIERGRFMERGE